MVNTMRASDYPDVVSWCRYLAKHPDRKNDSVDFKSIGDSLKLHGFFRITQLTLGLFGWKDLKECLNITMGTAILILQYAKEDVQAIEGR